jgi:hypothetical protein
VAEQANAKYNMNDYMGFGGNANQLK